MTKKNRIHNITGARRKKRDRIIARSKKEGAAMAWDDLDIPHFDGMTKEQIKKHIRVEREVRYSGKTQTFYV